MKQEDERFAEDIEDCAADAALYALGTLSPEKAQAVELRLRSGCRFCTTQAEHYAAVADQLALTVPPVQPNAELRQRLLNRLHEQDACAAAGTGPQSGARQRRTLDQAADSGVEIRPLIGQRTFMVRMQPGTVFPKHDHPWSEQCYVLEGSITDSDGLTLHAGDFVVMSRGIEHDPIRSATGCTLFIVYAD